MTKPQAGKQFPAETASPAEPLVTIFLTNAVRTSQGPGPGVKHLPASEASRLIHMKYAVYGETDPATGIPEPVDKPFGSMPLRRPAQSN